MLFFAIHVLLCQSEVKIMAANVVEVLCPSTGQGISPEFILRECDRVDNQGGYIYTHHDLSSFHGATGKGNPKFKVGPVKVL